MSFSLWHWIIVLVMLGLPVFAVIAAIRIFGKRKP
jgi:hypothetical protein